MEVRDAFVNVTNQLFGRVSPYDLLLFAIPAAFLLGATAAGALGHSLVTGFKAGGLFAAIPTAYALFGVPPTEERPPSGSVQ